MMPAASLTRKQIVRKPLAPETKYASIFIRRKLPIDKMYKSATPLKLHGYSKVWPTKFTAIKKVTQTSI